MNTILLIVDRVLVACKQAFSRKFVQKVGKRAQKRNEGGGGGKKRKTFLFSLHPPPPPPPPVDNKGNEKMVVTAPFLSREDTTIEVKFCHESFLCPFGRYIIH